MSHERSRGLTVATYALVVVLVGGVFLAMPPTPTQQHVASPDGSWSILVYGSQFETTGIRECTYEMHASLRDANGRVVVTLSVGLAENLASAERDFAVTFLDNDVVRIGRQRTIKRSDHFQ